MPPAPGSAPAGSGSVDAAAGRAGDDRDRSLPRLARARARAHVSGLRRALALVRRRPPGVLVVDLGVLRGQGTRPVQHRPRLRRDARRRLVPGCATQLRGAPDRRGRRRGAGRDRLPLPDARPGRAHVRRVPGAGGTCARRPRATRRRSGRSRRRVHAEHPRDARGVRCDGEPRGGVGELRARARRSQRHRPPRATRPGGIARGRRVRLPRPVDRPPRRGGDHPRRAAYPAPCRACPLRRARRPGCALLGGPARRARAARSSCRSPSTIRCSCCSRQGRPAGRRPSCTATAASCSSTSRRTPSAGT